MITRLLFIWFLREKSIVPAKLFEKDFAKNTLKKLSPESSDYYRAVLQNLFFATLNAKIESREFYNKQRHKGSTNKYRYRDLLSRPGQLVMDLKGVPFVNGGLFDCLDKLGATNAKNRQLDVFSDDTEDAQELHVPAHLFLDQNKGLFSLFKRYKFAVEENTPLDQEVALDPELLGRVFEKLLASYNPEARETFRKETGSYYTPRWIVDYMIRETLTEALAENTSPVDGNMQSWREDLRHILDHSYENDEILFKNAADRRTIVAAIANLKTLDPAVGSGAFPIGILQATGSGSSPPRSGQYSVGRIPKEPSYRSIRWPGPIFSGRDST